VLAWYYAIREILPQVKKRVYALDDLSKKIGQPLRPLASEERLALNETEPWFDFALTVARGGFGSNPKKR
jgi:hypothetical protein